MILLCIFLLCSTWSECCSDRWCVTEEWGSSAGWQNSTINQILGPSTSSIKNPFLCYSVDAFMMIGSHKEHPNGKNLTACWCTGFGSFTSHTGNGNLPNPNDVMTAFGFSSFFQKVGRVFLIWKHVQEMQLQWWLCWRKTNWDAQVVKKNGRMKCMVVLHSVQFLSLSASLKPKTTQFILKSTSYVFLL